MIELLINKCQQNSGIIVFNKCFLLIRCCFKKGYSEYIIVYLNEINFKNICINKDYYLRLYIVIFVYIDICVIRSIVYYNFMVIFGKFVIKIIDNLFKYLSNEFYFMFNLI